MPLVSYLGCSDMFSLLSEYVRKAGGKRQKAWGVVGGALCLNSRHPR